MYALSLGITYKMLKVMKIDELYQNDVLWLNDL